MGVLSSKIRYGYFGLALAVLAAGELSLAGVLPTLRCPLKTYLGVGCPMCGTTRAWCSFFEGHFREAFVWNPLFLLWGAACFVAFLDLLHKGSGGASPTVGEVLARRLAASPIAARLFAVSVGALLIYTNREALGASILHIFK